MEIICIFVYDGSISVRPDHGPGSLVQVFRLYQIIDAVGIPEQSVSDRFRNNQFVIFVIVALNRNLSTPGEGCGNAAVAVRAHSPLVFAREVSFVRNSAPDSLALFNSAVALVREEQASVRIVEHRPCRRIFAVQHIAVDCPGVSVRTGDQFPVRTVVFQSRQGRVIVNVFLDGIAFLLIEIKSPVRIVICGSDHLCSFVFVFRPGVPVRPCRRVSVRVIPAVFGYQPLLVLNSMF